MDLTRPFPFPAFPFLARLFPLLPRRLPAPPTAPDADGPAPACLHADLGLAPESAVPPDAQSLRQDLLSRTGLW